jgi:hypothetical protein
LDGLSDLLDRLAFSLRSRETLRAQRDQVTQFELDIRTIQQKSAQWLAAYGESWVAVHDGELFAVNADRDEVLRIADARGVSRSSLAVAKLGAPRSLADHSGVEDGDRQLAQST